jgi:hypothetical protein
MLTSLEGQKDNYPGHESSIENWLCCSRVIGFKGNFLKIGEAAEIDSKYRFWEAHLEDLRIPLFYAGSMGGSKRQPLSGSRISITRYQ